MMFNRYSANQNIKINAVSGTLVKNYCKSFFVETGTDSRLFSAEPHMNKKKSYYLVEEPVIVIQTMLIGDNRCISEVMWKSDFDEMFKYDEPPKEDE